MKDIPTPESDAARFISEYITQEDAVPYGLSQSLEQRLFIAVAENARLKAAMDKYSEDEVLLIERCAKACEVVYENYESKCDTWPEARPDALSGAEDCIQAIRALKVEPTQTIGGTDPEYLAEVFWRDRREK